MSDAKRAVAAVAAVVTCAVVALAVTALSDDRRLAFTLGVRPTQVAAVLAPGAEACQRPIDVAADARFVRLRVGTSGAPGPELEVRLRSADGPAARGIVPSGFTGITSARARLDREVEEGERLEACVQNRGDHRVALYGGPGRAARTSAAYAGGAMLPSDVSLEFERSGGRSALALVPVAFDRAALFRPGWMGGWVFWVLGGALVVLVPLLIVGALRAAYDSRA